MRNNEILEASIIRMCMLFVVLRLFYVLSVTEYKFRELMYSMRDILQYCPKMIVVSGYTTQKRIMGQFNEILFDMKIKGAPGGRSSWLSPFHSMKRSPIYTHKKTCFHLRIVLVSSSKYVARCQYSFSTSSYAH